jgi:hypothetical protein
VLEKQTLRRIVAVKARCVQGGRPARIAEEENDISGMALRGEYRARGTQNQNGELLHERYRIELSL